jgi:hypothetical protein
MRSPFKEIVFFRSNGIAMSSVIYASDASVRQLLDRGFEMAIHFAALGTNGEAVTGTYRFLSDRSGFECEITTQTPDPKGMTAPVNIMYVDSKGESAHFVLRPITDEPLGNFSAA